MVLCSRYDVSTYAYQGSAGTWHDMYKRHGYGNKGGVIIPSVTVFLDVTAERAMRRIQLRLERAAGKNQPTREAFESLPKLSRVVEGYRGAIGFLREKDPSRCILRVDAMGSRKEVLEQVMDALSNALSNVS